MGNCQAAEATTVVIQHPGSNKVDRLYWSVTARQVMTTNPGHFVGLVVSQTGAPVKQLKLLRPDDALLLGQVYRLVSFQDVLKEFASKKCVKLGKLLRERGVEVTKSGRGAADLINNSKSFNTNGNCVKAEQEQEQVVHRVGSNSGRSKRVGMRKNGAGQWKPALHTITELGI